ncbi:HTH-type transcriptional regulator VirS [Roseovarius albus]|uniref:HTH-type transcriptional regulator VirS n=1 Tax=Roseovarius albus TaxID=1247867 RepID=A0A1X6YR78_9RHOB|nr:AraC family transcriptional regulator [Roseovarius albus]SLN28529.1 HTH-type transcriptional regulator VirS [Roseovarius albus]
MPTSPKEMVSAHRLSHLAAELKRRTNDPTALPRALQAANLSKNDLGQEGHQIYAEDEARFIQEAVAIVQDKTFAATAGLNFTKNTSIPVYIAKCSENLRSALQNASRYTVLADGHFTYHTETSEDDVTIILCEYNPFLEFGDRVREFMVFTILTAMRNLTGRSFNLREIKFSHEPPDCHDAIARLAKCPVVFGARRTELKLSNAILDLPLTTYDPSLLRHLERYGDSLLAELKQPEPSLRLRVEALLIDHLPERLLPAPEVAAELGLSSRTFTRRLSQAGLTFSGILDELRGKLAKTYLAQSETSISQIAFLLGYADQAAFTTAFKRWSGQTPKAYRETSI